MLHYEAYIFVDTYHSKGREQVEKTQQRVFYVFSFDDAEEKVAIAVRFEGEKSQDSICKITLSQYLDPENELPIDPRVRFLCVVHPA